MTTPNPQTLTNEDQETIQKLETALMAIKPLADARPAVKIELCGAWLWVDGTDKEDMEMRAALNAAKYRWAPKKKQWYYAGRPSKRGRNTSMQYIRDKYGSQIIKDETN